VRNKDVGTINGIGSDVARGGDLLYGKSGLGGIRGGLWEVCEAVHGEVAWSGDHGRDKEKIPGATVWLSHPIFLHIWVIGWSYPYMGIWSQIFGYYPKKNMGVEPLFVMLLKQFSFATLPIKKQFLATISTFLGSFGDACIM
jgi:hypothetical protein